MASRFHQAKIRRAERAAASNAEGAINLIPLVDMLVSILFFSLLTYTGAAGLLTSFDLALPPVLVTPEQAAGREAEQLDLVLRVDVREDQFVVVHNRGFRQEIAGVGEESLGQLLTVMQEIKQQYPDNEDVLVVPTDATSYDTLIDVLERLRMAEYTAISLGTRQRAPQQVAAAGGD